MDSQDKRQLQWMYSKNKHRLTVKQDALVILYLYGDWDIGKMSKFLRVPAMMIKYRLERALHKLW